MRHNLDRLCQYFDCKVEDLMEHMQEDSGLAVDPSMNLVEKGR
jgi:hypothetical protein